MNILTYQAITPVEVLDKLFLKGDLIYVTPEFHVMNGRFAYARKVFDVDRRYLGMIDTRNYPESCFKYHKEADTNVVIENESKH